jgi:DNA (cytosine-5)-methyltransferase 1
MEKAQLDTAPVWDDVGTFDGVAWRGVVDCIAGGFPCQDISLAGKGAGLEGERSGLWREYARIVAEIRPRFVFVENVAALTARGLDRVLADLAALGFDAEWLCVRASDVGAPHKRERIFVLAHAPGIAERESDNAARAHARQGTREDAGRRSGFSLVADSEHGREPERSRQAGGTPGEWATVGGGPERAREVLADSQRERLEGIELHRSAAQAAQRSDLELPSWPPGPDDLDDWRAVLSGRPDLEPSVRRVADGLADRVDRLRVLGNGVVPQQAALAYRILHARIFSDAARKETA